MFTFHPFNSEKREPTHAGLCVPLHKQMHLHMDLYLPLIPHVTCSHLPSTDSSDFLHVQNIHHI